MLLGAIYFIFNIISLCTFYKGICQGDNKLKVLILTFGSVFYGVDKLVLAYYGISDFIKKKLAKSD
jgi:hypothetical protein